MQLWHSGLWEQRYLPFDMRTESDLLNSLLRSPEKADTIINEFRLECLAGAHQQELGLTDAQFEKLAAAIELGKRVIVAESRYSTIKNITSSSEAIEFCQNHFWRLVRNACQEEFHIVTLNTKNLVIDTHQITVGTLDSSLVHPREVFRKAMKDAASSILLVHNHPSGDPTPSKEDAAVTRRLEQAGEVVGIDVLDHIVVGLCGCVSIREYGI